MALVTHDLKPRIGTAIETDREALLRGDYADAINACLEMRGVLLFRGLDFDDAEQVAFTRTLGAVLHDGREPVFKVTLNQDEITDPGGAHVASYLKTTFFWHIDSIDQDYLVRASLLRPCRLPAGGGGQTEYCNTYAAYEDLPEADKDAIENLRVVHSLENAQRMVTPEPTYEELLRWQQVRKVHPLVWRHRSGRKSLVLGMTASHIEGMDLDEGRALLCRLREWATQPPYVYSHEWQLGDLLVWDNTGTMHRVRPYDPNGGRMMHRTKLAGVEPLH